MVNVALLAALTLQHPADSVQIVTRDIANFWHAYDLAAGKDNTEQVRIFRTIYLQPGSPGLRDWMRVRLMNRDTVKARMIAAGWTAGRLDSLRRDSLERAVAPFAEQSAAEELLRALRAYPRYYAAVRPTTLSVDTNSRVTQGIRRGLTRLAALYPEARFPTIYFLIGTLSTGGTTAQSGMLIGTEQSASNPATPLDELPDWARKNLPTHTFESLVGLVVHEAVHTQQKPAPPGQPDRGRPIHRARSTAARTSTRSGLTSRTRCREAIRRSAPGCTMAWCRRDRTTARWTSAIGWATGSRVRTTRAPRTSALRCVSCSSCAIRRQFCARAATPPDTAQ